MLKDLLDERLIQLHVHADGWEDAIRKAAAPLVETGKVKESYVDDIVKGVHEYGPYIVITKHVALPHARPESGALECAIGITTLDTPVEFGNKDNDPVSYLFCLSATDNSKHLQALADLSELLEDEGFYRMLDAAKNSHEVYDYLTKGKEEA
ncbi:MAG: PTS sugar transporter subunit IIA [Stecheria intestinalis]|nr:PTS sugar transporter subunit IIA [Stecheria intestinalis]MDY4681542.1 PTS sugar transporter subunit IIA [Lachnospiraceae bacterium]